MSRHALQREPARQREPAPQREADLLAGPGYGRHGLGKSFRFAFSGLAFALDTQRNLRLHFMAVGLVLLAAAALPVSRVEGLFLLTAMVGVPVAELFNTSVEAAVDLATSRVHPLARTAKDVAAAAVLVTSIYAVAVGVLVFGPLLWQLRLREGAGLAVAACSPLALAFWWPQLRRLRR